MAIKLNLNAGPPPKPVIKSALTFGFIILTIFFGGLFLWSTLAPIETAALAPGKVTVDTNRKTIQHLEGGIVKKIHIREGSKVKAGELLIQLNDTQAKASLYLLQSQINELRANEARLIAQRDKAKQITFPPKLLARAKKSDEVKKILAGQRSIFEASNRTFNGQLKILKQRIAQLDKEIKSLESQTTSESKQLKLIKEEIVAVEYLEARKLIEKPRLLALKREAARLEGNRGEHLGLIAKAEQRIGETEQQRLAIIANQQKETLEQLRETQQELADKIEREKAAQDILDRTAITSPQDGIVVGLKKHTLGGVIESGETILEIVPSRDELIIEARINPLDIDIVHKGLLARVQITSFKQRSTPSLDGIVQHISADSLLDQQTGESYYLARITISPEELKRLKGLKLQPGMPVAVMIVVDKQTLLNYFITPIKDSFTRAFREQ